MSNQSIPLRHIPAEIVVVAAAISEQTGLSLTDVYRLALASGVLVEATKITPDTAGTYAGLEGAYLAKALRRHLGSAIDLLMAYGEHPLSSTLLPASRGRDTEIQAPTPTEKPGVGNEVVFDSSLGDDLEGLGIGLGLSQQS